MHHLSSRPSFLPRASPSRRFSRELDGVIELDSEKQKYDAAVRKICEGIEELEQIRFKSDFALNDDLPGGGE